MRAFMALAMGAAPPAFVMAHIVSADRDWSRCFNTRLPERTQDMPTFFRDVLDLVFDLLSFPILFACLVLPFVALAALWAWRPNIWSFAGWAIFSSLSIWLFLSPETHHDCDRKGSDAGVLIFALPLLALPFLFGSAWYAAKSQKVSAGR